MPHRPLSNLAHVELTTPKLEESVAFARDLFGMFVVHEEGDSVYLRTWGDYYAYSLVLTEAVEPGLAHVAFRTWNADQLEVAAASVEAAGVAGEWIDSSYGHGRAYRFTGPGGHTEELFFDVDRAVAPTGEESPWPERPQRVAGHGIPVRILDHVTVTAPDVRGAVYWHNEVLDMRMMGGVADLAQGPDAPWFLGLCSNNEKLHDLGFILDFDGIPGRLHHVSFYVETNHELTEGAKYLIERGAEIDYGPGQHGIGEQNYLYFRDPAGIRYEINSGGYRNYVPDWEPVVWPFEDGPNNTFRTEIGLPAVHMVPVPPGIVGHHDEQIEGIVAKG